MTQPSDTHYSPFIPLCTILVTLILFFGLQFATQMQQYNIIHQQYSKAEQQMMRGSAVVENLQAMITDLMQLADSGNKNAQRIIKDLHIQKTDSPNSN